MPLRPSARWIRSRVEGFRRSGGPGGRGLVDKRLLVSHLPDDPVIVEAGAHTGVDTAELAALWPGGRVHAFEPVPSLYAQLVEATITFPNVTTYRCALGDEKGPALLHVSSGSSDGSSSLRVPKEHLRRHPAVTFTETVEVDVTTLDDWAAHHRIERVDSLWLDLQGHELAVLGAGTRVLRTVRAIVTEASLVELYEGAPLWPELRRFLEESGFAVVHEEFPWDDAGNVLLVRRPPA